MRAQLHAAFSQAPRPLDNPPEVATMLLLLESFCDYAEVAAAELPSYLRTVMPSHRVRCARPRAAAAVVLSLYSLHLYAVCERPATCTSLGRRTLFNIHPQQHIYTLLFYRTFLLRDRVHDACRLAVPGLRPLVHARRAV